MIKLWQKGLAATLRYPCEIRNAGDYFDHIADVELEPEMPQLAGADFARASAVATAERCKPHGSASSQYCPGKGRIHSAETSRELH